jgi:carboxyl-terminal processing protease
MRVVWAGSLALIAAVTVVCAAPVAPPSSAGSPTSLDHALRSDAEAYANNIKGFALLIVEKYIRPVSAADLYEAAAAGLYEAAGVPVPPGLRADIQRAGDDGIVPLLARIRESLGNVEALRGPKAMQASIQALPRALDPYCGRTPRREFQRLDLGDGTANTGLEFVGVPLMPAVSTMLANGRMVIVEGASPETQAPAPAGPVQVEHVQPGSPGQKAGIRPGDLITRINGQPPEAPGFANLFQRLRPLPDGGRVVNPAEPALRLTVLRQGHDEPLELIVSPTAYRPETVFGARRKRDESWDFMLDPVERIGYIRLGGIRSDCRHEVSEALQSLRASSVRGLVFDLRWCPGGYLEEATSIARLLLPPDKTPIASKRERKDQRDDGSPVYAVSPVQFYTDVEGSFVEFPVIVLVNGETSGGGELIAAALQDYGRAAIAGQRSVGKASVQERPKTFPFEFKLTTGTFVRPSGKNLQRFPDSKASDDWGIRPDSGCDLPLTADAGRRLKDLWVLYTLRTAGSVEALPLDDPENDPQRHAAVQMLRAMIKK